ncbi:helix-turn-helix transcriptional regulator [Bradyrhizobium ottawaense]|uniref:XRE family transcriptional regulator n=2 Tax=Bradyrhizobium ottawaense TaxID=931866 RepID=A0A2U8PLR0_9BRAD|nr:XRE family transcriptional regulator [Bradyrhizobium ottawaense]MBR1326070.1 helix-turn-helix transcriptional regulator [Bradyrhizobium ottawaense]
MRPKTGAIDKIIGERIRARRIALSWTQQKLGALLDLSFQQVQKYEKGENPVPPSTLAQIARAIRTDIQWFFGATETGVTSHSELREPIEVTSAFNRLGNAKLRRSALAVVKILGN